MNSPPSVEKPKLAIFVGPTAIGKSAAALKFASMLDGEIVNADSMQVYKQMNIGTAKPSMEDRKRVPHHLIDMVDPHETFNAALFVELARDAIGRLHQRNKPIFVVGGTGLYIRALLGGLLEGPGADENLRELYRSQVRKYGSEYLYRLLQQRDPESALKIDSHDTVRMIRAFEVMDLTGRSIAELQGSHRFEDRPYIHMKIGLNMERDLLFQRIENRVDNMMSGGFLEEVQLLLSRGYDESCRPMQSLGYRHILAYLRGSVSLNQAVRHMKRDSISYAKRQLTWFKKERDIQWYVPPDDIGRIGDRLKAYFTGRDNESQSA
ncbi:MAG: tRNA (adenosine(37)-N6)-dimethylallyltransferase MiaA [Syntrophales bacterium]|jgi:tRNA dimethylallyltransferase